MTSITTTKTTEAFIDHLEIFSDFAALRKHSQGLLKSDGLPAIKSEEYKYTPITKKLENSLRNYSRAKNIALTSEIVSRYIFKGFEGDVIVMNNGKYEPELSSIALGNYNIQTLNEAEPDLLGKITKAEKDPFVVLNNVYFETGIYITVPKNTIVEKPILILHFHKANGGEVIIPRILIEVEDNASVQFIEDTVSLDEEVYFSNAVTEIKVGENAVADFYRLQNQSKSAIAVNNFETDIFRDARFNSVVISLRGDMLRNNLTLNLLDTGCEGNMAGLYLINGKTHLDNHTNVDHTMPHSESNELYKGILNDQSKGVFNGKIFVRQDAQKTNAFQQNNNLILSEDAVMHTKPQLEIWADDVKCSHGCTTGQLDEEALFYIQSRGIGKENAKGLLLYAFAGEILEHIKLDSFKEYCTELVVERLGNKF